MPSTSSGLSQKALWYIIHHVFLPPQLPQESDDCVELENELLHTTIEGLIAYRGSLFGSSIGQLGEVISMFWNMEAVHTGGFVNEGALRRNLEKLVTKGASIPLHIRAQNAGVLISRVSDGVKFDVFELSANNEAVMTTKGRLIRSFPGVSVVIKMEDFKQTGFQDAVAHMLASLSSQQVAGMQPTAKKAGSWHDEDRDTTHPGMVSEVFVGFLLAVGRAEVSPTILKHTRDDIVYKNARSPWRRSATWMLIRVALQLTLTSSSTDSRPYKEAMLFSMAHILKQSATQALPSDVLYAMNAKIARRLMKMESTLESRASAFINKVVQETHDVISKHWDVIQSEEKESARPNLSKLGELDFVNDTGMSLPLLDKYIDAIGKRKTSTTSVKFSPSSSIMEIDPEKLPRLPSYGFTTEIEAIVNLHAFEDWVARHGRRWSQQHTAESSTCESIGTLLSEYYKLARRRYDKNPEMLSVMYLTVFELWIICDEAAIDAYPLLAEYDPGVRVDLLQNLLLPLKEQMQRLGSVEKYVKRRCFESRYKSLNLFQNIETTCFAVRYFDQSSQLQAIRQRVVATATKERQEKVEELEKLSQQHEKLRNLSAQISECATKSVVRGNRFNSWTEQEHDPSCKKCRYSKQAADLKIHLHEWPLPASDIQAKAVVFELQIPAAFRCWREATLVLLRDVLKMRYSSEKQARYSQYLSEDTHLRLESNESYAHSARLTLLSETKLHAVTHRKAKPVSTASEASVCLASGAIYRYFDRNASCFASNVEPSDDVVRACTYELPRRSQSLQRYLLRPSTQPSGPPPNTVIAQQGDCPSHMSLEEYKDLSTIPLGNLIQWCNILVQLEAPSVDFKRCETALFILQCIYQAGPPDAGGSHFRTNHTVAGDEVFIECMLKSLSTAVLRVKENWESTQALALFSAIASRILSMSSSPSIQQKCMGLLKVIRDTTFRWANLLRTRAHEATTSIDRASFKAKAVEAAVVCALCSQVDDEHLPEVLHTLKGRSILIQCSIIIQEGKPKYDRDVESRFHTLMTRFYRLLHRTSQTLRNSASLDHAIQEAWSSFSRVGGWRTFSGSLSHWMLTDTSAEGSMEKLSVHYNLLDGALLVNGLPLNQPPTQYVNHPMWRHLFADSAMEVMPTSVPGMRFSAKRTYNGFDVHIALIASQGQSADDLVVKAFNAGDSFETIPARLLQKCLPQSFLNDFMHWYNLRDGTVQFRPRDHAWDASSNTVWSLIKDETDSKWRLVRDGQTLIPLATDSARAINSLLSPLAEPTNIHVVLEQSQKSVEVQLPRLHLTFLLESGETLLKSKEYRGMSVDSNQALGTLVGFANKLMLADAADDLRNRLVLIPEGEVHIEKKEHHISISVDKDSIVNMHPLEVDPTLGRFIDNGSLQGKLFVAYIHALTAYSLPDPLTHRTGTEQALSIIQSAAVRSFERLTKDQIIVLRKIAGLTPGRCFYPRDQRVMQTISWSSGIRYMSHHDQFYQTVKSIFEQAEATSVFYSAVDSNLLVLDTVDAHLLHRGSIRSACYRVPDFGAEEFCTLYDVQYISRDREQKSRRGFNAFAICTVLDGPDGNQNETWSTATRNHLWGIMCRTNTVYGANQKLDECYSRFDAKVIDSGLDVSLWVSLHKYLQTMGSSAKHGFYLMTVFAGLAASESMDMRALQALAVVFTSEAMRRIELPSFAACNPSQGTKYDDGVIRNIMHSHLKPLSETPEAELRKHEHEKRHQFEKRQDQVFNTKRNQAIERLSTTLRDQWPTRSLSQPPLFHPQEVTDYVQADKVVTAAEKQFRSWLDNLQLWDYLGRVEKALHGCISSNMTFELPRPTVLASYRRPRGTVSVDELFSNTPPGMNPQADTLTSLLSDSQVVDSKQPRLAEMLKSLEQTSSASKYELSYAEELRNSLGALQAQEDSQSKTVQQLPKEDFFSDHLSKCTRLVQDNFEDMSNAVQSLSSHDAGSHSSSGARKALLWPRLSPRFFLQQLNRQSWSKLNVGWRSCVVQYGLALTALHRAERMFRAARIVDLDGLVRELQNVGHTNWTPYEYPETLLLEVESGIMIREVQEQIAREMRSPRLNGNVVMQLNMGEGKSSVIVPMIAAALANSCQLVRVVVAKSQSKQMAQMLISKLGGLIGRRVFYMPVSRSLKLDESAAKRIKQLLEDCMLQGGVLLVQPEHILSFKLMAIEQCTTDKQAIARILFSIQDLFDAKSRDIVDESDENFSVKFELIYTMGLQQPIEMSPNRWICIQRILLLVKSICTDVLAKSKSNDDAEELYASVESISQHPYGFPRIRILKPEADQVLVNRIASRICDIGLNGFPITRQPKAVRDAVFRYITKYDLTKDDIKEVAGSDHDSFFADSTKDMLFLLRRLLAGGVLRFVLGQKRWRVNYGLVANRDPATKLAVPYRAKDNPTHRSEFSHRDVVILLTLLSYYYEGLEDDALFVALEHLTRSDQAEIEFSAWTQDAPSLPAAHQQLAGINLKDKPQCVMDVFPHLRYSKSVVDYYLAHIVFPKEMNEFPRKLSASGWDIGKKKTLATTGFSGTNDSRRQLPLDVAHIDLPEQRHTNALVLEYLLQPANTVVKIPQQSCTSDAEHLLTTITALDLSIRVILDVGAQILEFTNQQVAEAWLKMHAELESGIEAAVFVNDDDVLSVVDRQGRLEALQTSSYASQLDVCLIYLDEAHTRGIDLRLPTYYRAAVTLGAGLTKDKLVQACMRMRKLGKGQTVTFCLSEEIQNKIHMATSTSVDAPISLQDVLLWAISETFVDTRRTMPLWAVQGERYLRQAELWQSAVVKGAVQMTPQHSHQFLEDEAQTLERRYRPLDSSAAAMSRLVTSSSGRADEIRSRCREFDQLRFDSSTLQEEQERELSPEIEQERHVQRPHSLKAATHGLHADMERFVSEGALVASPAYDAAFNTLKSTEAAVRFDMSHLARSSSNLLVSTDFARTVDYSAGPQRLDQYQRPVQWILSLRKTEKAEIDAILIISPFEANLLLQSIQKSLCVALHLYKPRTNVAYRAFDRLDFYTVPSTAIASPRIPQHLTAQLNTFAGQLYLSSYADYLDACKFLNLATAVPTGRELVAADGFIIRDEDGKVKTGKSPIKFLQALMCNIRRNGQSITKTHMGSVIEGRILEEAEFAE